MLEALIRQVGGRTSHSEQGWSNGQPKYTVATQQVARREGNDNATLLMWALKVLLDFTERILGLEKLSGSTGCSRGELEIVHLVVNQWYTAWFTNCY